MNELKRKESKKVVEDRGEIKILRMPTEKVNFRAVHENNDMLKALIGQASHDHESPSIGRTNLRPMPALTKGYHQVTVKAEYQEKTAFITPHGK